MKGRRIAVALVGVLLTLAAAFAATRPVVAHSESGRRIVAGAPHATAVSPPVTRRTTPLALPVLVTAAAVVVLARMAVRFAKDRSALLVAPAALVSRGPPRFLLNG